MLSGISSIPGWANGKIMKELIKIEGLNVRFHTYEGVVQAVDNINLDIRPEETFGLVGETGCGKTVTALSILRLIYAPGKIEAGNIYLSSGDLAEPIDLLTLSEEKLREIRGSWISMIFQEPSAALNPVFTIGDQIAEVILLHRQQEAAERAVMTIDKLLLERHDIFSLLARPVRLIEKNLYQQIIQYLPSWQVRVIRRIPLVRRLLWRLKDEAGEMAINVLKDVEIPDAERIFHRYPHEMSGGMKQRAVIAMALACSPMLLIADEPTTSLDVTIQAQILRLMNRLKTDRKASILYITHDLAVAAEICDRIGVMYAGSLCEVAGVDEIFANPLHPYTHALLEAVPKPGVEPSTIGGYLPDPTNLPPGCKFHPRCPRATEACKEKTPVMEEVVTGHFVACHCL
jgi:peptide/nickel transport system ATP-binding protein